MEWKIREIFEYNGEWYQCVEDSLDSCVNCCFYNGGHKKCSDKMGECFKGRRSDNHSVYFKKLEKVGEPYIEHDHSMNKDVVVQDYKLYNQHACYNGHEKILCFGLFDKDGIVTIKSKEPIKSLNCKNSVKIEIKQNKEDMEENKLNLKPFDIQKARAGKPVCTRDGAKARIICFDAKSDAPIIALITTDDGTEIAFDYLSDGTFFNSENPDNDLMMLSEKKEGWINVYKDGTLGLRAYNTKKEAFDKASPSDYVDTVKISWEE